MHQVIPRIFIGSGLLVAFAVGSGLSADVVAVLLVLVMALAFDTLWTYYQRHQTALEWIIDNVQLTDKPVEESDAPESVKKLVRREGNKTNT